MHQVTIGVDELKNNKAPVIGNNVFIGAGAIVTKSVPDGKTVVGINRMIDLTKVPEETRYIRNREVAENGYDMQETANRLMKIYLSLIGE